MKLKLLKIKKDKGSEKISRVNDVENEAKIWLSILKGSLIAISVSLVGILIFAFFIKYVAVPTEAIKPVNQVIKGISLLVGTFVGLRKINKMGLINGLLIGLFYTVLAFLIFSILDGNFEFSKSLVNDILFGGIIGSICGIISVNFRKKTQWAKTNFKTG